MATVVANLYLRLERFQLFLIYKSPWWFLLSFKSIGLSVQEMTQKIDFKDVRYGGHLGFPIGMILAIFDLPVTPMLPTKFRVNLPFGSGEEAKNRFSRWPPWQPAWISDQNNFSYFWSTVTQKLPTQVRVNWLFGGHGSHHRFPIKQFYFFFIYKSPWCVLPNFESIGLSLQEKRWK